MIKIKKSLYSIICVALALALMMPFSAFAADLEDGAYTVSRKTSYVNPETGKTEDGGTNIALGDSMCSSIVEDQLLVEKSNGKTYVTIGIGLMSNIQSVKIKVQDKKGKYRDAKVTKTGSCKRDGDSCNHYRFEVYSTDKYISPVVFVTPMGREVQFFVKLEMNTAKKGTGNFVSEMVKKEAEKTTAPKKEVTTKETTTNVVTTEPETVTVTEELTSSTTSAVNENTDTEEKTTNLTPWIIGGVVVLVVGGVAIWYFCFYKKKQTKVNTEEENIDED